MSRCVRPDCPGTVHDGYCDYCGFAPPSGQDLSTATQPGRALAKQPDTQRVGSGRPGAYGPLEMARVPTVPYRDPKAAVLADFDVVGSSPSAPRLRRGELVSGQYLVHGCLAHGGLGRIYLAYDNNVGHWVVLKGLLDISNADGSSVVAAERAALAEVNHSNIVKIHNFVQHPPPDAAANQEETQSYIVMEYIGGRSLKQLLDDLRREKGTAERLPVSHVIAYGIEMLRALDYLHHRGLLYCDLKPANVMQCERQLTLIDLGATRPMDGATTRRPIMGTPGFQAPEVASEGPSVYSDLYTVGRTMAALSFPFDFTSEFAISLPVREQVPLLTAFESYDRLLRRATHRDPRKRFRDAAEMVDQLFGVLREVLSAAPNSESWPDRSTLFGPERRAVGTEIVSASTTGSVLGSLNPGATVAALPVPVVAEPDEMPGLAELAAGAPEEIIERLAAQADLVDLVDPGAPAPSALPPASSPEAKLVLVRTLLERGRGSDRAKADKLLHGLAGPLRGDWRRDWYRGLSALTAGRCEEARENFDDLYSRMPGEAAPKLALAFSCEGVGEWAEAAGHYENVWRTDHSYVSAAFGLARVRLQMDHRDAAVRVLDEVPSQSTYYGAAQLAAMAVAVRGRPPAELTEKDLLAAEKRLAESRVDGERRNRLAVELLDAGLKGLLAGLPASPDARLLDAPLTEDGLRRKLEDTYRVLARFADDTDTRHALVTKANTVRPRTFV